MPTIRQRKVVDKLVENGGNVSQAMMAAGYTPATAKTPQKVTESIGFKQILEEKGLTPGYLIDKLKEDIDAKPRNRKPELELGMKVNKMLVDQSETKVITMDLNSLLDQVEKLKDGSATD